MLCWYSLLVRFRSSFPPTFPFPHLDVTLVYEVKLSPACGDFVEIGMAQ